MYDVIKQGGDFQFSALRPLTKSSQRSIFLKEPKKPKGKDSSHVEYNYINTTRKKPRR